MCFINFLKQYFYYLIPDFAEPFGLCECILAILHCAGHSDSMLIESMWNKILDTEIEKSGSASPQNKISILSSKLKSLGKMYASSQKYFPMGKDIDFLRNSDFKKFPNSMEK